MQDNTYAKVVTRPCRMGKSLNINMLAEFLDCTNDNKHKPGLAVMGLLQNQPAKLIRQALAQVRPHSFEPVSNGFSRVLILGTMPSVQSREAGFYYAHPRNRFWPMLAGCFGFELPQTIEDKKKLLLKTGIALWDVLATCEIDGSDDSTIRNPVYNDIAGFIDGKPIVKIICNGRKAYGYCRDLKLSMPVVYLPSTSPANAAWSLERLVGAWKAELSDL